MLSKYSIFLQDGTCAESIMMKTARKAAVTIYGRENGKRYELLIELSSKGVGEEGLATFLCLDQSTTDRCETKEGSRLREAR